MTAPAASRATISRERLKALVENLRSTVGGLHWEPAGTAWADYAELGAPVLRCGRSAAARPALVGRCSATVSGRICWDLGANTGAYSRIAAALRIPGDGP